MKNTENKIEKKLDLGGKKLDKMVWEQLVPAKLETVWAFFSDEKNLESITPPWLNFHVTGMSDPKIQHSTRITYKLRLRGIPLKWESVILLWDPPHKFVDFQLKGPYGIWHHLHEFETTQSGTLIRDTIHFQLPLPWLSWPFKKWVKKDVTDIFNYRQEVICNLFPA